MHFESDVLVWHLAIALVAGTVSFFLSKKTNIAPIVFFIILGIALGPSFLGVLEPDALGKTLNSIVFLGVAIILFEGGLTLDYSGYKKAIKPIVYLLSLGVIISWLVNAVFIYWLFNFSFIFSLFCSSLIIVTGPTVITPILRRININKKIFNILHWEGVLIDPIGVFLAILCFEILISGGAGTSEAFFSLIVRLGSGFAVGSFFGFLAITVIRKRWLVAEMRNAFTLSIAILTFVICDNIASESGLLGVIVCGLFIGIKKDQDIEEIKRFKLEITEILIGILFILLAANLNLSNFNLFGTKGLILLALIILVTRPFNIFASTIKSNLKFNEKLFLSWISPRGIVVASMASLFYIALKDNENFSDEAWFVETFTFSVIIITVLFQGLSAGLVAKGLKINQFENKEWVIVGIHELSAKVSDYLISLKQEVILLDNNLQQVNYYKNQGYNCLHLNALSNDIFEDTKFFSTTHLLALTDNLELNALICQHWKVLLNKENLFRWGKVEKKPEQQNILGNVIWESLPKPSKISSAIIGEEKEIVVLEKIDKQKLDNNQYQPLLHFEQNQVVFTKDNNNEEATNLEKVLLLKSKDSLKRILIPQDISFYFKPTNMATIINDLTDKFLLKNDHFIRSEIINKIEYKVNQESVSLGKHFALINLQDEKVETNYSSLTIIKKGIDLKSYDKLKTKVIFTLITSGKDAFLHIKLLTEFSRLINNPSFQKEILTANTPEEIIAIYQK